MTLIHELDLDILKMFLHTKTELSRSRLSEVRTLHHRQTHRHTDVTENIITHTLRIQYSCL